jgi:hypothetical protein
MAVSDGRVKADNAFNTFKVLVVGAGIIRFSAADPLKCYMNSIEKMNGLILLANRFVIQLMALM